MYGVPLTKKDLSKKHMTLGETEEKENRSRRTYRLNKYESAKVHKIKVHSRDYVDPA